MLFGFFGGFNIFHGLLYFFAELFASVAVQLGAEAGEDGQDVGDKFFRKGLPFLTGAGLWVRRPKLRRLSSLVNRFPVHVS